MSKYKNNFKLIKESNRSNFHNEFLINEYDKLVENNLFVDNHLHINTVYLVQNDYEYEIGIYITNNSEKELFIKYIPIALKKEDIIIKEKLFHIDKRVRAFEALYIELKFNKSEFKEDFDISLCDVEFGDTNILNKYNYTKINFDGIDKIRKNLGYRQIKKFIKNLYLIDEGSIAIDVFSSGKIDEEFFIILLIRNSSNENINIKSIPLEIYTQDNLLFYKNDFLFSDKGIEIQEHTGVFKVIVLSEKEVPEILGESLDTIKVKIR